MKTEAKSRVCAVCAHAFGCVCTLLCVYRCYEFFVLPCALVLCWCGCAALTCACCCVCVCVCVCVWLCVCVRSQEQHNSDSAEILLLLFSLSHLALFLLFLLPLFPHPPLLPCLLNEGTGKFYLHFLKNVITIIIMMMMVLMMMVTVLVKIKGGESGRVSSSRGRGDVRSVFFWGGLETSGGHKGRM